MKGDEKADLAQEGRGHDAAQGLEEVRRILFRRGLLEAEEELSSSMLEDLVHYAYFTGCITKRKVKELLGLTDEEARERIRRWKRWHEGNRMCQARQNPFYEGWADSQAKSGDVLAPSKEALFEKIGRKR